ncbi:4-alpha-glucanotransferase dpe1, chloroplastic/amyloplastic [Orobanche hederae]
MICSLIRLGFSILWKTVFVLLSLVIVMTIYRVYDMELVRILPITEDEVNVACFHPLVGGGLVYGTKFDLSHGFNNEGSCVPGDNMLEAFWFKKIRLYDWKAMERNGFSWWIQRLRRAQNLFDEFHIDHFRGFAGFWAIPSEVKVAMVGRIWSFWCCRSNDNP